MLQSADLENVKMLIIISLETQKFHNILHYCWVEILWFMDFKSCIRGKSLAYCDSCTIKVVPMGSSCETEKLCSTTFKKNNNLKYSIVENWTCMKINVN